jgi:muramoyltetrapeptide carboxypeptidase
MRIPPFLNAGDRIGLVSTARKISLAEIEAALGTIRTWGFEPVIGRTIGLENHQFAGSDADRAADLQDMLDDPSVDAVMACRGGYGTSRIIDLLDFTIFMENPKWIVGYSDLTILHAHLNTVMGMASLHASMPVNFQTNTEPALNSIRNALTGKGLSYEWGPNSLNRPGEAEAEVVGGNLSLIYSLLGTKTGMNTTHKILFLEDLDEYLYHIDRMMVSLKRAGKLDNLAGLIVGGMTDMNDNDVPYGKTAREIIAEHAAAYDYPVSFDFPAGHQPDNRAIVLGGKAKLSVKKAGCSFEQGY